MTGRALFLDESTTWRGESRTFVAAARGLVAAGWTVRYACFGSGPVSAAVDAAGIERVELSARAGLLRTSARLRDAIQRGADVVFVHRSREHLDAATAVWRASRGAVVRRLAAGAPFPADGSTRTALRLAPAALLCTSAEQSALPAEATGLRTLVADLGIDVERVASLARLAPVVVEEDDDAPVDERPDRRRLVCVCDAESRARVFVVLRAVAMLAPRHPELQLVIVGAGAADTQLRMHAAALGIHRLVRYLAVGSEVTPGVARADVGWVVADGDEGAYGALDLMALGVPVLAHRGTIAARYVADNITGRHLDPNDVPGTAAVVASMLARDDERRAMGTAGRARAARAYGETAMIDGFERIGTTAIERARRSGR